jgi:hypothetical protein
MTTAQSLIDETRGYLLPTTREPLNTLSGAISSTSATSFTLGQEMTAITTGTTLAVDLELMYVWAVAGQVVTVQRGMGGSTAATHTDGTLVRVNPRFPDFRIFNAMNAELDALSAPTNGLYQIKTVNVTFKPQINGYDLTGVGQLIDVLRVRYDIPGPWKTWPEIRRWQLKIAMDSSDFASTYNLVLYDAGWPGRRVHIVYSAPFTHLASATDDVQVVSGLGATANDILPLGAALRLAGVRETQRSLSEAQGDPRRATEVPPNAVTAGANAYARLLQQRIKEESSRLSAQYPNRRKL